MRDDNTTEFINVDLDLASRSDLQTLLTALGRKVHVLFAGRVGRKYEAHLELSANLRNHDADSVIRGFCKLIEAIPPTERQLWNGATQRDFSIGIQAGMEPHSADFAVSAGTVQRVAVLGARIVITVYRPSPSGPAR